MLGMEIGQAQVKAPTRPRAASTPPPSARPLVHRVTQTGADLLCLMDLDETTAALCGDANAPLVNAVGVLDGLKVIGLGAARLQQGQARGSREAMLDGGARMALGAGSVIPGLTGNCFVAATGAYLAVQGLRTRDRAQTIAGLLQIGVAGGFYAIGMGAGLPAQAAILALQAGKIATYAAHRKHDLEVSDSDRLGRFMHGYLHRHDHWGQVQENGRGPVWADTDGKRLGQYHNLALVSEPIVVGPDSVLAFELRHDLEEGALHVEARQGEEWEPLERIRGKSDWTEHRLDLSRYQDQHVELRFRVQTDGGGSSRGCYLDRVRLHSDSGSAEVALRAHEGDLHD